MRPAPASRWCCLVPSSRGFLGTFLVRISEFLFHAGEIFREIRIRVASFWIGWIAVFFVSRNRISSLVAGRTNALLDVFALHLLGVMAEHIFGFRLVKIG